MPTVQHSQVLKVGQLVGKAGDDVLRETQGGQVDEAAHLRGQGGQSVGVEVELGEVGEVPHGGRQHRDVTLAKVQPRGSLLPAVEEGPGQVEVGRGDPLLVALPSPLDLASPVHHCHRLLVVAHVLAAVLSAKTTVQEHVKASLKMMVTL